MCWRDFNVSAGVDAICKFAGKKVIPHVVNEFDNIEFFRALNHKILSGVAAWMILCLSATSTAFNVRLIEVQSRLSEKLEFLKITVCCDRETSASFLKTITQAPESWGHTQL